MKTFASQSDILIRAKAGLNIKSDTDLAAILGISKSTLSNWNSEARKIDYPLLFSKCEQINLDWLLTGEGNMLREGQKDRNTVVAHPAESPTEGIPLIPISAMAGAFTGEQVVLEYECERFVVPTFKGAEFLISVKGSSMYPKYNSGDIVACKHLPMDDLFFQWNKVYVLDTDQGPLIKRIKPGSDKEHVLIVSDNEQYEPFELSLKKIYHVALVIGVIRLE